jgi:hypothetical protein
MFSLRYSSGMGVHYFLLFPLFSLSTLLLFEPFISRFLYAAHLTSILPVCGEVIYGQVRQLVLQPAHKPANYTVKNPLKGAKRIFCQIVLDIMDPKIKLINVASCVVDPRLFVSDPEPTF